ncbi:Hypothetical protein CINCED_3A023033 [Cinara cedri]|uniref:Uncharacterized protein n=1 Tax=Cinara cedri TaxID=506608 RepID=A0A5E4N015_9HEMI|nr:Hypothetical protein CINCED_3A023033 [Cinara cedri]
MYSKVYRRHKNLSRQDEKQLSEQTGVVGGTGGGEGHDAGRPGTQAEEEEEGQQKRRRAFWSCITDYWTLMETAICRKRSKPAAVVAQETTSPWSSSSLAKVLRTFTRGAV